MFRGETAANERWGFAFSTKEAWHAKVKSDVASIVSTDRDYARIYCITSRYAPDKARAALEDALSAEVGVPVTILDRTWILDKIYASDRLSLAVETLGLTASEAPAAQIGPNDAARLRRLGELDRQIAELTPCIPGPGLSRPRSSPELAASRACADERVGSAHAGCG